MAVLSKAFSILGRVSLKEALEVVKTFGPFREAEGASFIFSDLRNFFWFHQLN